MDLGTVMKKLSGYKDVKGFIEDVELIFANCCRYNAEGSDLWKVAVMLRDGFHADLEEIGLRTKAGGKRKADTEGAGPPKMKIKLKLG